MAGPPAMRLKSTASRSSLPLRGTPCASAPVPSSLAFAFAPVLLPQTAAAQTAQAPARSSATPAATAQTAASACDCPTPTVQRHYPPYTAKQTTTRVQTLADGTHITTVTTAQIWRDADGRMRTETINTPTNGTPYRFISIYDPTTGIRMSWTVGNPNMAKVVTVYHYSQPVAQPAPVNTQPTQQRYYPTTPNPCRHRPSMASTQPDPLYLPPPPVMWATTAT